MSRWLSGAGLMAALCLSALALPGDSLGRHGAVHGGAGKAAASRGRAASTPAPAATDPTIALRDLALALPALDGAAARRARAILSRPPDGNSALRRRLAQQRGRADRRDARVRRPLRRGARLRRRASQSGRRLRRARPDRRRRHERHPRLRRRDRRCRRRVDRGREHRAWLAASQGRRRRAASRAAAARTTASTSTSPISATRATSTPASSASPSPTTIPPSATAAPFKCSAHLVVDNDYDEFGESGGELGLRVTTAHEYNHVLQFNLDSNQDAWMFESTATWSEEQVFPDDDDWVRTLHGQLDQGVPRPAHHARSSTSTARPCGTTGSRTATTTSAPTWS